MPLEEHRLLGGDGMAALLAPDAAIEWWCTPRLDSSPALWRLLDDRGGVAAWRNAVAVRSVGDPAGHCARTVIEVDGRQVSCWDGLVRIDGEPSIVRLVRALREPVEVTHELTAAVFDPQEPRGAHLLQAHSDDGTHHVAGDGVVHTTIVAVADRWQALVLRSSTAPPPTLDQAELRSRLREAEDTGARRAEGSGVVRAHRNRVEVALLVLDACTEPSTGAVVASPTTSVPEVLGADRQFDYRYAWVRDASLASSISALLGQPGATNHHVDWLLERCLACEGIPVPVTDILGRSVPEERELADVAGRAKSRPVRVGNGAKDQEQVDGAGFVAEAVWILTATGGGFRRRGYQAVVAMADHAASLEPEPSGGIWEQRDPDLVTSADVGLWLLFDRALRLRRLCQPWAWRRRRRWSAALVRARRRVDASLLPSGALPVVHGGTEPDGAALLLVVLGLLRRDDPRASRLVDATIDALGIGDPVVALRRYPTSVATGFEGDESAFLPVSWWAVSALAQLDRREEAHAMADRLCEATPGLQPEMLDVEGVGGLGNLPLVWSHAEAARALYLLRVADLRGRWGRSVVLWKAARFVRQALGALRQRNGRTDSDQNDRKPF